MRVDFPYYDDMPSFEVADDDLIGVFEPPTMTVASSPAELIRRAFVNPIGSDAVGHMARRARKALILTDDYTRRTPVQAILGVLIPELLAAGLDKQRIRILVALGTHRPMTDDEILARFGDDICSSFEVLNHDYRDTDRLVDYGTTEGGIPIRVNKAVQDADLIVGIGQIVPHRIAGFSGGGKIVLPGICGEESTAETHWRSAMYSGAGILGVADNPVRLDIERAAKAVGLGFIANAVCDASGQLMGMFAGDPVAAHRAGAKLSERVYGVSIPEAADILVIDSHPMDLDLWQGAKALYAGELAVKKGGVVVLVSPCHEGVSRTHDLILREGYRSAAETIALVDSGRIRDRIAAAHLVRVGRVIRDNGVGILVSQGIKQADAEILGFRYAATPQQAIDMAREIKGRNASVLVLRHAGTALPRVATSQ